MYFHHYFHTHSSGDSSAFWGAVAGAFFAFIFGLIAYWLTKRRERFVLHRNTLITMDRTIMKHLFDFGTLETLLVDTFNSLKNGHTTSNRLNTIAIPENIEIDIASIYIANKVFDYRMSIERLNSNIKSTNHSLTRLEDLFIAGQPVLPVNFDTLKANIEHLLRQLPQLNTWAKKLLILERIHQHKLQGKSPFFEGMVRAQWEQDISKEEIEAETKKLETEVSELAKKSPDDIF